jgi:hypothetical protein
MVKKYGHLRPIANCRKFRRRHRCSKKGSLVITFKTALDDTSVSRSCLIIHSRQQLIVDLLVDTQYMYDL